VFPASSGFAGWLDAGLAFDADPVVTYGPTIAANGGDFEFAARHQGTATNSVVRC
jgi:hypothetical protein